MTFYNTMLSRMANIKIGRLEDPETGESLSNVETALSRIGIHLRDSTGQFRNFEEVLSEVGAKWKEFDTITQRSIALAFSGVRQQTRFLSLMAGWDQVLEYTEVAATSAGTAMEKFGSYQEGLEAKSNRLTAAFENMANSIVPSGLIGFFLDLGAGAANLGASLGGLPARLFALTAAISAFKAAGSMIVKSPFANTGKDLAKPKHDGHQWNIVANYSEEAA